MAARQSVRLVEAAGVAADDPRHRRARRRQAVGEGIGDRRDVVVERAAGDEHRGDDDGADPAEGHRAEGQLQRVADARREHDDD